MNIVAMPYLRGLLLGALLTASAVPAQAYSVNTYSFDYAEGDWELWLRTGPEGTAEVSGSFTAIVAEDAISILPADITQLRLTFSIPSAAFSESQLYTPSIFSLPAQAPSGTTLTFKAESEKSLGLVKTLACIGIAASLGACGGVISGFDAPVTGLIFGIDQVAGKGVSVPYQLLTSSFPTVTLLTSIPGPPPQPPSIPVPGVLPVFVSAVLALSYARRQTFPATRP
ncbi:MAG: hypothetical protein AB7I01_19280 [Gammaproteobacteria bacterium]